MVRLGLLVEAAAPLAQGRRGRAVSAVRVHGACLLLIVAVVRRARAGPGCAGRLGIPGAAAAAAGGRIRITLLLLLGLVVLLLLALEVRWGPGRCRGVCLRRAAEAAVHAATLLALPSHPPSTVVVGVRGVGRGRGGGQHASGGRHAACSGGRRVVAHFSQHVQRVPQQRDVVLQVAPVSRNLLAFCRRYRVRREGDRRG